MTSASESTFFRHRAARPVPDRVVLSGTTRYLCGAAYLTDGFPRRVTAELIDNEHRGVAPSIGFDLGPVLRHCYRARFLLLYRDAALTAVLLLGFLLAPSPVIWLVFGTALVIAAALGRRHPRLAVAFGVAAVAVLLLPTLMSGSSLPGLGGPGTDPYGGLSDTSDAPTGRMGTTGLVLRIAVLYLLAVGAYTWWRLSVYRVLTDELAPGRQHKLPEVPDGRIRARAETVSAAQWGNLALLAHRDPFLGAGRVLHSWSMSLELRTEAGEPARVDPVALQRHVRERLEAMRDEPLPDREQIAGLVVLDHIVASGERGVPDPLISTAERIPCTDASPEAVEAIIRHPQGSLRYYLHAVVGAEGREVYADDRLVTGAHDQEIVVSTFLYVAVEGGMLYLEFVATVLPPLREHLHVMDHLVPERNLGRALREAVLAAPLAAMAAPVRLVDGLLSVYGAAWRMDRETRRCREQRLYDYGARMSVRQAASASRVQTYLQQLDAEKYYKLVERGVTSAVLDFLELHDVDTSEYRSRALTVLNNGVMITGGTVTGPVAGGANATASVQNTNQATPASGAASGGDS